MRIFITGITGTLGRAFAEVLNDHELTGVDHNESSVSKFRKDFPSIDVKVGDFEDADLEDCELLIHLAAMKHIDLCETNAASCIKNNVIKTYSLFLEARSCGCDILFMSTDKAVEPTSNYGYSKALMESMALEFGGSFARSGNIVASNGSVLGVWDEAIKNNKPIKITHKDMRRFFISADHLANRIWERYLAGDQIIIPIMDREVGLLALAKAKIKAYGKPDDYPIEFIGLRPGEKLEEKLKWEREK